MYASAIDALSVIAHLARETAKLRSMYDCSTDPGLEAFVPRIEKAIAKSKWWEYLKTHIGRFQTRQYVEGGGGLRIQFDFEVAMFPGIISIGINISEPVEIGHAIDAVAWVGAEYSYLRPLAQLIGKTAREATVETSNP